MKIFLTILFLHFISLTTWAQSELDELTHWQVKTSKTTWAVGEEVEIIFFAQIDKNWQLYSSDFKADIGPLPTVFKFSSHEFFELIGEIQAIAPKKKQDKTWDIEITYFDKYAEFKQKIKVLQPNLKISGNIKGLVCNEKKGLCLPFENSFQL